MKKIAISICLLGTAFSLCACGLFDKNVIGTSLVTTEEFEAEVSKLADNPYEGVVSYTVKGTCTDDEFKNPKMVNFTLDLQTYNSETLKSLDKQTQMSLAMMEEFGYIHITESDNYDLYIGNGFRVNYKSFIGGNSFMVSYNVAGQMVKVQSGDINLSYSYQF